MPELILAIDVGTTSTRAVVFAASGQVVASAAVAIASHAPAPGKVEQNAAQVWRSTRKAIDRALAQAGRTLADIAAIGITSQRTSVVLWDRRTSRPLTPLVVWSDLRGEARARELRDIGYPLVAQQAATKLESMVSGVGGAGADLAWGNIDSFVIWKLTGGAAHVTDRSQAWPTGYLDLATMGWNLALIERQGLDEAMFPAMVDTRGRLAVTAASVMGAEIPIAADVADQQSALIAHGERPGVAKVTYGTSATLNLSTGADFVYRSPTAPPFVLSSVGGETAFCLEAMVLSAGAAIDWLRKNLGLGAHLGFERLAAKTRDAGGAAFLPALHGLGAPYGEPARRALFAGLNPSIRRPQIARAALEGVAFRVREVFEHLFGMVDYPPPDALGVDGGLAGNGAFLQIQADLLGRPVRRHAVLEATACGAAMSAGLGAGLLTRSDADAFIRYDRTFEPMIGLDEAASRLAAWKGLVYAGA
jgi:glycerol kinase